MADGTYERRGPREAELKRFKRLIEEVKAAKKDATDAAGSAKNRFSEEKPMFKTIKRFAVGALCLLAGAVRANDANDFEGDTDAGVIQTAIDAAHASGENVVRIPAFNRRTRKAVWIVDRALRLPSGMTVILDNAHLRLADGSFCNIFTNSKSWDDSGWNITDEGLTEAGEEHDIAIIGEGQATLDGGEFNGWGETTGRQTGRDLPKHLYNNCPIFFHNVRDFRVENLHIRHPRYWSMTYSYCSRGVIRDIRFDSDISWCDKRMQNHDPNRHDIPEDGYENVWVKNGDGVDLRCGTHDVLVENVYGFTEDDGVAMTALPGGEDRMRVGNRPGDIWNITIRNNRIHVWRFAAQVRMLCSGGHKIHDILVDGIQDPSTPDCPWQNGSAVLLSDCNPEFLQESGPKRKPRHGETYNITLRNIHTRAEVGIRLFNDIDSLDIENLHLMPGVHTAVACPLFASLHDTTIRGVYTAAADGTLGYAFDWFKVDGRNVKIADVYTAPSAKGLMIHRGRPDFISWDNADLPTNGVRFAESGTGPRFAGWAKP